MQSTDAIPTWVDNRAVAAAPWICGLCFGGFVVPIVIYAITREARSSLAFQHARAACAMWVALVIVWLPGLIAMVAKPGEPPTWTAILAALLGAVLVLSAVVGSLLALLGIPHRQPDAK